jgi:hypothetical protein
MFTPAQHSFTIYQGVTFDAQLTWRDEDDLVYDLSDYTARMRFLSLGNSILYELTTANGGITLDNVSPNISLLIPAPDLTSLPAGKLTFDLDLTALDTTVTRLLTGVIHLTP